MGYTTKLKGVLEFTDKVTAEELAVLNSYFGEDARDHEEWDAVDQFSYIDFRLTKDFSGIEWDNNTENGWGFVAQINFLIEEMKKVNPHFGLTGELLAQGEYIEDRWKLVMVAHDCAERQDVEIKGRKVECPECRAAFFLEDSP